MTDFKYKGKTLGFLELLSEQKVEVPIIQRDYAQGREDKQEIRENFLNAIYQSINELKSIKLDFIYGSKIDGSFQPLDGQQRLTTLFLLYWYSATKDKLLIEKNINLLKKFSYETRISSREFCNALVSNPILIKDNEDKLSKQIVDASWFFLSWKKDPTIDAMLRTIDDIHKRFYNMDNLWEKLTSEKNLISFYYVELENIGLTDDLYIKMNARGKLLSPYENFKARFQKYITDNKWELNKDFINTFACKIDTTWTDLFWSHRKDNSIDEAFIRFISTMAMIRQSCERTDDRFNIISRLQENPNSVKSELFSEIGFKYLCETFDIYYRIITENRDISLNFPLWQHEPQNNLFLALVYDYNNASYTQKVLFYAQTEYLRHVNEFNLIHFRDWMRVIRNIVSRGDIDREGKRPTIIRSPQAFDGVINLINELSEGCENIYDFLACKEQLKSTFAKEQLEEERLKAKLIIANSNYKKVIFDTEDTNLLQGRIEFALYCINYDKNIQNIDVNALQNIQIVITKYFNTETSISNELRRALLTICDDNGSYNYYGYWWSFWNVVSANKRCLIDKYRELEYFIYGNYKNRDDYRIYFKKLIIQLIEKGLNEIISSFIPPDDMPNWKVRLIKESDLLDNKSKSNYIAIPDDESCCYLLKSRRPRDLDGCEKIE